MEKKNVFLGYLKEYREPLNNWLLCKAKWVWQVEIYDKKTRMTWYVWPSRTHNDIGLKWVNFQALSRDVRCPSCDRLLCRWLWVGLAVEINCSHCKEVHLFKLYDIYQKNHATLPVMARNRVLDQIKKAVMLGQLENHY